MKLVNTIINICVYMQQLDNKNILFLEVLWYHTKKEQQKPTLGTKKGNPVTPKRWII